MFMIQLRLRVCFMKWLLLVMIAKNANALVSVSARNFYHRLGFIVKGTQVIIPPPVSLLPKIRASERLLFRTCVTNAVTSTSASAHATTSTLHSHWNSDATSAEDHSPVTVETKNTPAPGLQDGFVIVDYYATQQNTLFDIDKVFCSEDIDRLKLTPENITLPAALCLLQPDEYPSLSRARKACRKGSILIHRHEAPSSVMDDDTVSPFQPLPEPFQNKNLV